MWPRSVDTNLEHINTAIGKENMTKKDSYKRSIQLVKKDEYYTFHALMIVSILHVQQGIILKKDACKHKKKKREGFSSIFDFGNIMKWW